MKFRNEYGFLSNFAPSPIKMRGMVFPTAENAFQAAKTEDLKEREVFTRCSPAEAKKLGRRVTLRPGWEEMKEEVMYGILQQKFKRAEYREQLLKVEGEIVEENDWGDTYWGVCRGRGKNRLGVLLMKTREELK